MNFHMDATLCRSSQHPQSSTHRSPELAPISLTSMAESYERMHMNEPTAAQKFAQEQRQQQQQQQMGTSVGSSTIVYNSNSSSHATTMNTYDIPIAITSSTSSSSISLFGSALSVDNGQEDESLPTNSGTMDNDEDESDDQRPVSGFPMVNDNRDHTTSNDDADDPLDPSSYNSEVSDDGTDNHLESVDSDGDGYDQNDDDDDDDDDDDGDDPDDEWRGYRRTPRDDDEMASQTKQGGHIDDSNNDDNVDKLGRMESSGHGIWQTYQPDYYMLNDSYQATKNNMYKDIEISLGDLQQLEMHVDTSQLQFQGRVEEAYQTWSQQLEAQRRQLAHRHRTMNDDYHHGNQSSSQGSLTTFQTKIKLNVGGDIFETSLTTLKKDEFSLLATMFSGKHVMEPDQEGAYFIDRDPTHFRLVLNYLRDRRISPSVIQNKLICQELLQEAEFYRIDGLVKLLV